jgi:photosystem II stability/assembly factor-like uncharacterized protein
VPAAAPPALLRAIHFAEVGRGGGAPGTETSGTAQAVAPGTACGVLMGPFRSVLLLATLLALALCCVAPALALEPAGDGWYWQAPQPQGQLLNSVSMSGEKSVWAVGNAGVILHSSDGGASWTSQSSPTSDPLADVAFTDALHGCAVGGAGWNALLVDPAWMTSALVYTGDGGSTWQVAAQPGRWALCAVSFPSAADGWAVGQHGTILHTTDGGATWSAQRSGTTQDLSAVTFTDTLHGYAVGSFDAFVETRDGGVTWKRPASDGFGAFWCDAIAVDAAGTIWLAKDGGLVKSRDGGHHWRDVDLGDRYPVYDIAVSGSSLYAAGYVRSDAAASGTSRVAASSDGGATWSERILGQDVSVITVAAGGASGVCAAGLGVVASQDGGATWTGGAFSTSGTGSLDFVSATEGWATGGGFLALLGLSSRPGTAGRILHTSDGATWQEQSVSQRHYFTDVAFADAQHGWAVGTAGAIRHTTDGGVTWAAQALGTRTAFQQVEAPSPTDAWVLGMTPGSAGAEVFMRTTDAGSSWTTLSPPEDFWPFTMRFVSGAEGWAAGWGRKETEIAHTTDGGATWTRSVLKGAAGGMLPLAMDFTDPQHGWLVGTMFATGAGAVLRTQDGGATWMPTAGAFKNEIFSSVDFIDRDHGWVAGRDVWSTADGGMTWTREVASLGLGSAVAAIDAGHVWAGADGYGIVSTVDASGDTAPPTTTSVGARGWIREGTSISLAASDAGGSGVATTEYRLDGGAWQAYAAPLEFPAPADHSGDGRRLIEYRSTDKAGLKESIQAARVDVDTIQPVIRLRPSKIGRDGVLRLRGRIDDASCPSISEFDLVFRSRRGRVLTYAGFFGFSWPMNRWYTFRQKGFRFYDGSPGVYRVSLYAADRAGNKPVEVGSARIVVKRRPARRAGEPVLREVTRASAGVARGIGGFAVSPRAPLVRHEATALPGWLPQRVRDALAELAARLD